MAGLGTRGICKSEEEAGTKWEGGKQRNISEGRASELRRGRGREKERMGERGTEIDRDLERNTDT